MEGILQCLNTVLPPSKTEITVDEEWNVTWNSLDERILITALTARALGWITDESKIRPAVYFNMKVSITQRDKYGYDWCVRPLQTNIILPASFNISLSVSLCPCKKTLLQVQTNLVEPWQVSDKHVPLLYEIVLKKKKLYTPSRKKSTSCTYHCVQKYFRPVKSI